MAAKLALDKYGADYDVRIVNNPVVEEGEDNPRFAADVSAWLGREVEPVINPRWPACSAVDVWETERFMSGPHGASCTRALKKQARQAWELTHKPDWHVLGFTVEERRRHQNFILTERPNALQLLIDARLTKDDCARIITSAGILLPQAYRDGFPNANCEGCVKAASPTYWNHVRKIHPDVFASRAEQSRRLGVRLVKVHGKRVFLDELDPATQGRPMKSLKFECGLFCEEDAA